MSPSPGPRTPSSAAARLSRVREILEAERPSALPAALSPAAPLATTETHSPSLDATASDAASDPSVQATATPEPARAAQGTRLALSVLSGAVRPLAKVDVPVPGPLVRLGTRLFPAPGRAGDPSRLELVGLGAMLVGAAFVGSTLPGSPVQAQGAPQIIAAAPAAVVAAAAPAAADAAASPSDSSAPDASSAAVTPPADATGTGDTGNSDSGSGDSGSGDTGGDSGGDTGGTAGTTDATTAERVALIVVHGDAPVRWATAADGSAARTRVKKGRLLSGVAQLPGSPLANGLAYVAGQPSNAATRAGCTTASPVTPGTVDAKGITAGDGCDYPSATPSLAGAVARDGRTWKAYVSATSTADASARLCHPTDGAQQAAAQRSPLGHLGDLVSSGACDSAATPLSSLRTDLKSDTAPAWIYAEIGDCGSDGCDEAETAKRDADLDAALDALSAVKAPNGGARETIVIGDGDVTPLDAAPAGSFLPAGADAAAPAPVISGALLLGDGVEAASTDALALDPFAIAKTQATWLGLDAPGLANADGVSPVALPGA